jgi:methyl-accepting chemotaxis protein
MYERFRRAVRRVVRGSPPAEASGSESGDDPVDSTRADGGVDTAPHTEDESGRFGTDADAVGIPEAGVSEPSEASTESEEEPESASGPEPEAPDPTGGVLDAETLLDAMPVCVFVLSPEREVLHWNRAAEELCGAAREDVVGTDEVSVAFYHDGRRAMTLADKVVEAPESADTEFDVRRSPGVSYTRYEDTSTMVDATGKEVDIWFTAQPVYRDGEFAGVVEMVHDRSDDVREGRAVEDLIGEVTGTLAALCDGDLSARASAGDVDTGALGPELLAVLDQVNETAAGLERVAESVGATTGRLADRIDAAVERAGAIDERTGDQHDALEATLEEVASFERRMSSMAEAAERVAASAEAVRETAAEGSRAGEEAREATERIVESGERVARRMDELESHVENVVEVVDVISTVAERTNLLALNASIEAARAGGDGTGFEVVAREVKTLAEETRTRTEEIREEVETIREHTDETVSAVEDSNDRIDGAGEHIESVLDGLDAVTDEAGTAASGIEDVAIDTEENAERVAEVRQELETAADRSDEVAAESAEIATVASQQAAAVEELEAAVAELTESAADRTD